jgi:uncharacterized protein (DUF433 family)
MGVELPLTPRPVPLFRLENGVYRVTNTRIPLERIVEMHKQGATPEQIVESCDVLRLTDVYTLIGYYLDHQAEVNLYLDEQERDAEELRRKIEAAQGPPRITREILLERKARMEEEAARNAEVGR